MTKHESIRPGESSPGPAENVESRFAEWKRTWEWANERGLDDDEVERRGYELARAEKELIAGPIAGGADLARKVLAASKTDFSGEDAQEALAADAERLLARKDAYVENATEPGSVAGEPTWKETQTYIAWSWPADSCSVACKELTKPAQSTGRFGDLGRSGSHEPGGHNL